MTYDEILPCGSDTGNPLILRKRVNIFCEFVPLRDRVKVMDCGCGSGAYLSALLDMGYDVLGIEYDISKVERFRSLHPENAFKVSEGNLENIPFPDSSFDAILLNEVIEHVPDDTLALREISRVLISGGKLIIFAPNRYYPFETHGVYLKKGGKYLTHYMPFVPWIPLMLGKRIFRYWARNYWPRDLIRIVKASGFVILKTGFVWQTFEGIFSSNPVLAQSLRPILRSISKFLEMLPVIKKFGVSQLIIAYKR